MNKMIVPHCSKLNFNHNTTNTLLIEPFTLSWLALQLAEGALSALGAKMLNGILNSEIDLNMLQTETLKKIGEIVREAISDDSIRRCSARVDCLTTSMKQYFNSPTTSIDRLYYATNESVNLVSECKSLGFKALLPFCTAVGLEIVILQERLERFNEQGERQNIVQLCKSSQDHVFKEGFPAFLVWSNSRFTELRFQPEIGYYYIFNEEIFKTYQWYESVAAQIRKDHMTRVSASTGDMLFGSSWDVGLKWYEIQKKYEYYT